MKKRAIGGCWDFIWDIDDFIRYCKNYDIKDEDGYGYYSDGTYEYNIVLPSDVVKNKINTNYNYVVWYNR